jgi:hypothetical protein
MPGDPIKQVTGPPPPEDKQGVQIFYTLVICSNLCCTHSLKRTIAVCTAPCSGSKGIFEVNSDMIYKDAIVTKKMDAGKMGNLMGNLMRDQRI